MPGDVESSRDQEWGSEDHSQRTQSGHSDRDGGGSPDCRGLTLTITLAVTISRELGRRACHAKVGKNQVTQHCL
jgi:hypothetical protein